MKESNATFISNFHTFSKFVGSYITILRLIICFLFIMIIFLMFFNFLKIKINVMYFFIINILNKLFESNAYVYSFLFFFLIFVLKQTINLTHLLDSHYCEEDHFV